MKFGVVVFPGSNCDADIIHVLEHILKQEVVTLWHKDTDLQGCDFIILPGGFSYGDYLRSGAIARFSPIMQQIILFAQNGGYVLGICNGFQILCEAGLLPGALLQNDKQQFICKNVHISAENYNTIVTRSIPVLETLQIPIAHGEGRFFADADTIKSLKANGQILFRYCDAAGNISPLANPNGSLENIAGVCNATKNVFGMMPHPERAADVNLGNTDGLHLFQSIIKRAVLAKQ